MLQLNLPTRRAKIVVIEPVASLKLLSLVFLDGDECMVNNLQMPTSEVKLSPLSVNTRLMYDHTRG